MTGHRAETGGDPSWRNWEPAVESVPLSHQEPDDEFVGLACDYPGDRQILPVRDVVEIRGWALAKSGIDRILIRIGDDMPVTASYGIPRPDVARTHPEFIDADQSGYRFF